MPKLNRTVDFRMNFTFASYVFQILLIIVKLNRHELKLTVIARLQELDYQGAEDTDLLITVPTHTCICAHTYSKHAHKI